MADKAASTLRKTATLIARLVFARLHVCGVIPATLHTSLMVRLAPKARVSTAWIADSLSIEEDYPSKKSLSSGNFVLADAVVSFIPLPIKPTRAGWR